VFRLLLQLKWRWVFEFKGFHLFNSEQEVESEGSVESAAPAAIDMAMES
jgi:hypothetical protein